MDNITGQDIRLAYRDVRLTAGWKPKAWPVTSPGYAAEFALTIMNRYLSKIMLWSFMGLVYKGSSPVSIFQHQHSHTDIHITTGGIHDPHTDIHIHPRIDLRLLCLPGRQANSSFMDKRAPFLQTEKQIRRQMPQPQILMITKQGITEEIVHRLITRRERSEPAQGETYLIPGQTRFSNNMEPERSSGLSVPMIPPVTRVFRRSIPAKIEGGISGSSPGSNTEFPKETKSVNRKIGQEDNLIDVNRLTDKVIQAIDQRIIAQRERMGRI